ncbi:hypothetical protein PhCBS80983_g06374 [Powellomyces hirtus]|uniref:FHA domain-containing protein n=1 Tax=Powellomyces hirtus TaxID=109895 RepID=A0A507DQ60_9FUNG|nr:hypothetical protein PhCBS80983_g06374 [Powellomyces hirtus]
MTANGADDWTRHPSGKYFISKSSPWCYSETAGYFYFDASGRMVKQGEDELPAVEAQNDTTTATATITPPNNSSPATDNSNRGSTVERAGEGGVACESGWSSAVGSLEDGEIGDGGGGVASRRGSAATESKSTAMDGFEPMDDPRYFFHRATGYVYDSHHDRYTYWDDRIQRYLPVPDPRTGGIDNNHNNHVNAAPESNASMKLVVVESKLLEPGAVVLVDASGLTVGRDTNHERRLVLKEMTVSRSHCTIFVDRVVERVVEDIVEDRVEEEQHEEKDQRQESETMAKVEPAGNADFHQALERAKAIAARLMSNDHKRDPPLTTDQQPTDTKRLFSERDDIRYATADPTPKRARITSNKEHRAVHRAMDCFFVTDGGSTHGTYVNGTRLSEPKVKQQHHNGLAAAAAA